MAGVKPIAKLVPEDAAHEELRVRALSELDAIHQSVLEARSYMRSYQAALEKTRRNLREGGRASDMPGLFDVSHVRSSFSTRLENIERARTTARTTLWRLQALEGMTNAEIARAWGFSRQLVSRTLSRRPKGASGETRTPTSFETGT